MRALRGATTLDADTPEEMRLRVAALLEELYARNGLCDDDVISMLFTSTPDIRSLFPAAAARAWGVGDVALMGAQEADIAGALPRCVRVLAHVTTTRGRHELVHVYQRGAVALRPDLARRP